MARKDVDLVIRAKDEAAKVVDSITAAINDFVEAQDDLGASAGKTESTLGRLGVALGGLDKELRGLSVSNKVGQELDKAAAAAKRLNSEFEQTQASARDLARDLQKAEYATARLAAKSSGASQAQQRATASLDRQKLAQTELTASLAKATAERGKLAKQEDRLNESLTKQEARIAEVTSRYTRLSAEVAGTAEPTKTMQNRLESANQSMQKQIAKLAELRQRYEGTQAGIAQTGARMAELTGKLDQTNAAVVRQEAVVSKIGSNYRELQAATKTATRNQNDIAAASDKTADALARQAQRIERAQVELQQLGAAAGKADEAMSNLANRSGVELQRSFEQQRRVMLETKREWVTLTQEASKLAAEIGRVGVPTRAMAEAFVRNRAEAARAKQEYIAQRNSLHQLSGVLRQAGGDLDSLRSKQAQFAAVTASTGAAIARIRQTAQASAGAYNLLSSNANKASQAVRQTAVAAARSSSSMSSAAASTNSLAGAYRRLYGESRQAMSWTQRLRGEVLSLIAAYGGIYGVINLLQRTVDAYQTLEAATARLGVAFDGDQKKVGEELDFVRRMADRLGVEFGSLATEYSKFSIATKGTNLEGENTRKIFTSVAEAARVNRSTFDELRGVFVALTQIVSKGAVQMEELRQQLGDRLPGALQLMADGLGVGTDELIKMMEQGQITADALVPFAEELDRRFGPGLADSLKSTTAALGRFQNAAFQALVQFGNNGFIESFTRLLDDLTETLKSADFQAFSARVSKAFGVLVDVVGLATRNFDLLVIAASAFLGIKLTPLVIALGAQFLTLGSKVGRVGTIFAATRTSMAATTTTVAATTTAFRGLTLATRALVSSTGIGLAITAISIALGYWATRADEASEALNAHQKIVDQVRNAYDKAAGSVDAWKDRLDDLTTTQARTNLIALEQQLRSVKQSFEDTLPRDIFGGVVGAGGGYFREVEALYKKFDEGSLSVEDFRSQLDSLSEQYRDLFPVNAAFAEQFDAAAKKIAETSETTEQARDILIALTGTQEEARAALERLNGVVESNARSTGYAASTADKFREALERINSLVPEIGRNLELMKQKAQLDDAFESAARAAQTMGELQSAVDAYNGSLGRLYQNQVDQQFGSFTDSAEASAALLRSREGFTANAQFDVNAYRAGFGSDTVTLADGTIKKVVQGMRVSVADANRDLVRRIGEFQSSIRGQIGSDRFDSFNPQQQAALTSVAYNYGELPERILEAVRTGTNQEIANSIRSLQGDNDGVNAERRNVEAALFTSQANVEPLASAQQAEAQRLADEAERRAEAAAKFHEEQQAAIDATQFELSLADQGLVKREQAKAIREAELAAQRAGTELTETERAALERSIEAKYRQQALEEQQVLVKEQAAQAEERVNQLLQHRQQLQEQLSIYQESGDTEKMAETKSLLEGINTQLEAAIDNSIAMWKAVGGGAADAAIAKLQTAKLRATEFEASANTVYVNWSRVGDLFADGLVNAFDSFAQAVANGKNVGEAARDAFLQFAADFLREVSKMILKQIILNALQAVTGMPFGALSGHTGGRVGSSGIGGGNVRRAVNPAIFASAARFHNGGIPGLAPNEVPAVLKADEEVLTEDDPRHMFNQGQNDAKGAAQSIRQILLFDPNEITNVMASEVGEQVIVTALKRNASSVRSILGG